MNKIFIKLALYINYFVFAILLNSVGIVISKSIQIYKVTEQQASVLEAFKDLPIAIVSFFIASFLPRLGYKNAILIALGIVFFGCMGMYFGNSFNSAKWLFLSVGVSFALIKLSVYSLIGVITDTPKEHAGLMSSVEGVFMVGISSAYFLFPAFFSDTDPDAWLNVYLVLGGLIIFSMGFILLSNLKIESISTGSNLKEDLRNSAKLIVMPLVLVFISSAFFFVMVEQGIMTWLPHFNAKVFQFSDTLSVQMASILALSLAFGRFIAGWLSKYISWYALVICCSVVSMALLLWVLPKLEISEEIRVFDSLRDVPYLGFILPLIGLFIAPIYPLLNSTVLSHLPKNLHSPMSGLIIIFSALGGTLGSRIVGTLFQNIGGINAFYFLLIPLSLLIITVLIIKNLVKKIETNA